jgi:hypothetical protein
MDLLRIRVETLKANINKIKSHLEMIPDRRIQLDELQAHLTKMSASLIKARRIVFDAKMETEGNAPGVSKSLGEVEEQMMNVVSELQGAREDIAKMHKECFPFVETDVGKAIAKHLNARTSPFIKVIGALEDGLLKPDANLKQHWKTVLSTADDVTQSIFAEYIEFLGGLALRDRGFDEGISRVADKLLGTYSTKLDPMLAIPTRRQAVAMSLARILRVTYPDWTIWALPSSAHEFWNVVAQKEVAEDLCSKLRLVTGNDTDNVEPRFNDCLGDAFATYTMGPAYAFFAIFLLLNPSSPFTSGANAAADDVRAHAICEMLTLMNSEGPEFTPPMPTCWRTSALRGPMQSLRPALNRRVTSRSKSRPINAAPVT